MPIPFAHFRFIHKSFGELTESTCSLCSLTVAREQDMLQLYLAQAAHISCHDGVRVQPWQTESQENRSLEASRCQSNNITTDSDLQSDSD